MMEVVIGAKAMATFLVGLVSMVVAFAIGAVGNLVGSALAQRLRVMPAACAMPAVPKPASLEKMPRATP